MEFKERVKQAADIVEVIGEVVRLKPAGGPRFKGLCPFHQEKTPSFNVDRDKQFFHCFGCGKGGDVFKFVMEIEAVGFYDALKSLADRYAIAIPKRREFGDRESQERDAVQAMQEIALASYREALFEKSGADARAYLEKRGVTEEAIETFALGYAPPGNKLLDRLRRDYPPALIAQSGLVVERDDGTLYERFRNRLMFPIHDERGRAIAFGGRALGGDEPKYLNSSDSRLYTKKRVLYNLHRAKETIRKAQDTILVEGYMDAIGLWQAGVKNAVAPCGTALSDSHVAILRRHSENVVLLLDADEAGKAAVDRIGPLIDELMRVRVLQLPDGLDPDEFILKEGKQAFAKRLERATPYFEWLCDRALEKYPRDVDGRRQAYRETIRPALLRVKDRMTREAHAASIAAYVGVEARALVEDLKREPAAVPPRTQPASLPANETLLLNALLDNPGEARTALLRLAQLSAWKSWRSSAAIEAMVAMAAAGAELNYGALEARLDDAMRRLLAAAVFADKSDTPAGPEQLRACVSALENADEGAKAAEMRARIRALEKEGRLAEALELERQLPRRSRPASGERPEGGALR